VSGEERWAFNSVANTFALENIHNFLETADTIETDERERLAESQFFAKRAAKFASTRGIQFPFVRRFQLKTREAENKRAKMNQRAIKWKQDGNTCAAERQPERPDDDFAFSGDEEDDVECLLEIDKLSQTEKKRILG